MFDQAVKAGATVTMPLANQFWGDRYGQLKDPFGHKWALGQHIEDVSPEEMERRANEAFAKCRSRLHKSSYSEVRLTLTNINSSGTWKPSARRLFQPNLTGGFHEHFTAHLPRC